MCAAQVVLLPLFPRVSSPAAFCIHVEELETATTSANSHFPWHGKCELACIQNILECVPLISNDGKAHAQRVCVCVHRRTGDEGKQTNTHKLSRALQPSLCGDGLHLHHVDPMPHSRSAPSPPHTVSSPLASSNWGLPELAGQQQLQQEDAFSWQRAVPLGARRRVHLCQNSTEASKPLKSSELFPVDHTAVLFWWGFYVSINIHGSST